MLHSFAIAYFCLCFLLLPLLLISIIASDFCQHRLLLPLLIIIIIWRCFLLLPLLIIIVVACYYCRRSLLLSLLRIFVFASYFCRCFCGSTLSNTLFLSLSRVCFNCIIFALYCIRVEESHILLFLSEYISRLFLGSHSKLSTHSQEPSLFTKPATYMSCDASCLTIKRIPNHSHLVADRGQCELLVRQAGGPVLRCNHQVERLSVADSGAFAPDRRGGEGLLWCFVGGGIAKQLCACV